MWRSRRWVGCAVGTAALAMVSGLPVGCAGQPRKQVPKFAEASKNRGLLAGVSWSVIEDESQPVEHQAPMAIGQHSLTDQQVKPSPEWLDLHGGKSRPVNREPDLGRYEF